MPSISRLQRMSDRHHMSRALELALRGQGFVEPNPMVGCVLVRDEQIVGEGWHAAFGGPHAEIVALESAGSAAQGATAYVTLEPCCHSGKTPPCTEALVAAGIQKVVLGCRDPNSKVDGGGIAALQAAGIQVDTDLLEQEATRLIAPFIHQTPNQIPPLDPCQMGDDPRWKTRHAHRQQPMDLRRSIACRGSPTPRPCRCHRRRARHGGARRSSAHRSPGWSSHGNAYRVG